MKTLLIKCIGVLVDGHKMRQCYRVKMAKIMSERYGKSPEFWSAIDEQIVTHWADYHADLNFSGEDGIADIHEALFRVTRALFTIGKIPEPPKPDITALANELISSPCKEVLLPDALSVIEKCRKKGYTIGTFSYLLEKQVKAITAEIPNLQHVIGADTLNHYEHDAMFFRKLSTHCRVSPDKIVLVATSPQTVAAATQSGMHAISVRQFPVALEKQLTYILKN